ncbi:MAG: NB-ARC domain-containing protein [Cyanobacteriota bacterium]|nr:NB-ARC domain-containing protein [Cyanobacteriota bacterium]
MTDSLKASKPGLQLMAQKARQKGWTKTRTPAWWMAAHTSQATLRRFWRGLPILRENFMEICAAVGVTDWEAIVSDSSLSESDEPPISTLSTNDEKVQLDWGEAPEILSFYGRAAELSQLERWITQERCKVVSLLGMGGMGKTSLAVVLADQISEQFDYLFWRSLYNGPPIEEILTDLIQLLSPRQSVNIPQDFNGQLGQLMNDLRSTRCLIVLDNVESILSDEAARAGCYRSDYSDYGEFFRRISLQRHQSCLLLTSREELAELVPLKGRKVRSFQLSGLSRVEGQSIFRELGAFSASEEQWQKLVEHYAGNPLALKIVAAAIRDLLNSNIVKTLELLQQESSIFDEIYDLLEQQFNRLSEQEQEVMYWLAIAREPVTFDELQGDIFPPESRRNLLKTLKSLKERSLLETYPTGFTQQPVVMEYISDRFIAQVCEEIQRDSFALLKNHALLKAQAKDYIRETQWRLLLRPVRDRLLTAYGTTENLTARLAGVLDNFRDKPSLQTGYIGGNILNLLCQMGTDLAEYDFSRLVLWQAYLRGVALHRVNFTGSDLSKSVFNETFGSVVAVTFSPDGTQLATCDVKGTIYLWNVRDGKKLLAFKGHEDWIFDLAFSPQGHLLASGSLDRTIKLWDVPTGECLKTLSDHSMGISCVAFNREGNLLASGSGDQTVKLWDVETGECRATLTGHGNIVRAIAFSADGEILASASLDKTIKLWSAKTGKCLRAIEDSCAVFALAFAPTPSSTPLLASGGDDFEIKLWDAIAGQCLQTLSGHQERVWSVAFSGDGSYVASGGDDFGVKVWEVSTGNCLKTLPGHNERVWSVAFSPNSPVLASGSDDSTVKLWDVGTGQCLRSLQGYDNGTRPFAFNGQGTILLASCDRDSKVKCWDIESGRCLKTLDLYASGAMQAVLSPDGQTLACGNLDHTVRLYAVENGDCLAVLRGHSAWSRAVAFSPQGDVLASGSGDRTVKLWHLASGECRLTLHGHNAPIQSVAFSPSGQWLASGSWNGEVKLWEVGTGECLYRWGEHRDRVEAVAFHRRDNLLFSGSLDCTVKVWNLETGHCQTTLNAHDGGVRAIAIHPRENILATAGQDSTVKLWDISQGVCLTTLPSHLGWIGNVIFSPDGRILANGSEDGINRLWDVKTGRCFQTLSVPRLYEGMNIAGVKGLTEATKMTLKTLGAI